MARNLELVEGVRVLTFDPDCAIPTCVHGWGESRDAMGRRESIVTSQMGLLADPLAKGYDEVRIIHEGRVAVLRRSERQGRWDTDSTDKAVRSSHNWLRLWLCGDLDGTEPFDAPSKASDETRFEGTPIECEVWLRRFLGGVRMALVGLTSVESDGGLVPGEGQGRVLSLCDRSVWRVTVTPLDLVATEEARQEMLLDAERMKTERMLFDALASNSSEK